MGAPTADVMIVRARPWSDGARIADADAVAIGGGRVIACGRAADLAGLATRSTRTIDAGEATVTAGVTDAHLHLLGWARSRREVDLLGAASAREAAGRVASFVRERGPQTVIGRGWDANDWADAPHHAVLDAVAGDRPVVLHSKDFHALWVNGAALRVAGVGRDTPDPQGGVIERDARGEPTGVLREHATRLCTALLAGEPEDDPALVDEAVAELHAAGVTAVHDFEGAAAARLLRPLADRESPRLRVLMHLTHADLERALELGLQSGVGNDGYRIGAIKLFADGTLGSRTAAMLEPYDGSDDRGIDLIPPDALRELVRRAFAGGLSVAVHAIGDRAVRSALDAFAASRAAIPGLALPPRIEHAQLVADDDVPRFAALGVVASMQPAHCTADRELAGRAWSRRVGRAYPWRALLASGATLAFGSDAPVEPPSVAAGLHAAVTRTRPGDRDAFVPEQAIGLDAALAAYVDAPARVAGASAGLGTLRVGAPADVVVWNADLHRLPGAELHRARPVLTLIAGEVVWSDEREGGAATDAALAGGSASR